MTVRELEATIWDRENVRVVVRAGEDVEVGDYGWSNAAQQDWSINKLMDKRIRPTVGDHEVICLDGRGRSPHGRTLVRNVRSSYS